MKILQFLDHLIPYETFLNDLSSRIVRQLKADKDDPEFISQRKAYELFGSGFSSVPPRTILMKVSRNRQKNRSRKINDKHIMANTLMLINFICLV